MNAQLRLLVAEPRTHVTLPDPSPTLPAMPPRVFDWQADEDGDLTDVDLDVVFAVLDGHETCCARDAGRKLRRHLAHQNQMGCAS